MALCKRTVRVVKMHYSELIRGGTMLLSDLLARDNDALYNEYVTAINNKDLPVINTIRNIIYDRYSIRALEHSPIDNWRNSKEISRFFTVKR